MIKRIMFRMEIYLKCSNNQFKWKYIALINYNLFFFSFTVTGAGVESSEGNAGNEENTAA